MSSRFEVERSTGCDAGSRMERCFLPSLSRKFSIGHSQFAELTQLKGSLRNGVHQRFANNSVPGIQHDLTNCSSPFFLQPSRSRRSSVISVSAAMNTDPCDQALEPLILKKPSSLEVVVEMTANYLRRNPPRCC